MAPFPRDYFARDVSHDRVVLGVYGASLEGDKKNFIVDQEHDTEQGAWRRWYFVGGWAQTASTRRYV